LVPNLQTDGSGRIPCLVTHARDCQELRELRVSELRHLTSWKLSKRSLEVSKGGTYQSGNFGTLMMTSKKQKISQRMPPRHRKTYSNCHDKTYYRK
jgi:hypothetical protein